MPPIKQATITPAHGPTYNNSDLLGLTPPPIDNRQRYLRFVLLQEEETLIPLSDILEVMHLALEGVLPVPNMPSYVLGVCSWQSETLWLVDLDDMISDCPLRQQLDSNIAPTVIVVQSQGSSLGLVVEGVSDIELFDPAKITMEKGLCPPSLEPYVLGYCPSHAGTVLNISKIIHSPLLQVRSF